MALIRSIVDDGKPASIQGEQQQLYSGPEWATDDDVDAYVRTATEGELFCRERNRHLYPPVRKTGLQFVGVTDEGLFIRRIPCESCGKVNRVELWDVRHKGDRVTRAELVTAVPDYVDKSYLNKSGRGRMRSRQVRNAVASLEVEGSSFRGMLKVARSAGKATP